MADRDKIIKGLECCINPVPHMCRKCSYKGTPDDYPHCVHSRLQTDTLELLKEQEKETDRILKIVRDVIYSGVSIDTEPDQDYVYELIRNGVQQSYMERR